MVDGLRPGAVPRWMDKLKNGSYMSNKMLEHCLLPIMTEAEACKTVENAIKAGILVPKRKATAIGGKRILLCFSEKLRKGNVEMKDPYCFECHFPSAGPVQKCLMCIRSFHIACQRKNPRRPNYSVPSDRCQPHRFPRNESDMEVSDIEEVVRTPQNTSYELDCNSNINIVPPNMLKYETGSSDDVYFVSEQPARKRRHSSTYSYIKSEDAPHNDANIELQLCTPCRLQKMADFLNPPHISIDELNCLLGYSWQTYNTWITKDVRKYMAKNWNDSDSALVKNLLFMNETLGVSDITHSIETKKFKHLSEFFVDVLDLQHNTAIFFGTKCEEYNATKWLLRDITHDIREINRCSDCYRHSNESNRSAYWFAKPCTQRHELVFAKQSGSPHWPAKVIRVMTKRKSIYDVRFFGGTHSRALIPVRDILPIDADSSQLKKNSSRQFIAAMEELKCHTMLLHEPMYIFSFHADPREAEDHISRVLPHCMEPRSLVAARSRAATPSGKNRKSRSAAVTTPNVPLRVQPMRRCSLAQRPEALQDIAMQLPTSVTSSPTIEVQGPMGVYHELIQKLFTLNEKLTHEKCKVNEMTEKMEAVKRKRWCQHCLQEALFDCCFTASYCSNACKRRDKRRHQETCRLKQPT